MDSLTAVLTFLAAVALGLTAGALLAEAALLVPFWRSMEPVDFLAWYKQHAALLQGFFGPLEVAATLLVIVATGFAWTQDGVRFHWLAGAALLSFAVLAAFPLYFQRTNAAFRMGLIPLNRIPDELVRWSRWHWGRTVLAIASFSAAVIAAAS